MTTPPASPTGKALTDLTGAIAQALGQDWTHAYPVHGLPNAAPSPTLTRAYLHHTPGSWRLAVDSEQPNTPGLFTVRVVDTSDPFYEDTVDWQALPPGSEPLVLDANDTPAHLANTIEHHLLNDAARARQRELGDAMRRAATQHAALGTTLATLARTIETAPTPATREQFQAILNNAAVPGLKVVVDDDSALHVVGLSGYTMRITDPGRVHISISDCSVDTETAALIAALLKRSDHR